MLELIGKKILGVFCHADDEIVAGWPLMQQRDLDRSLVIICDDVSRKGEGRLNGLIQVCKEFGITLAVVDSIDAEFYRLPTRYADVVLNDVIRRIRGDLLDACLAVKPDYIFTHNPVGEYGHGDHRLLFELVSELHARPPLIISDLCEKNKCHRSYKCIPDYLDSLYYKDENLIGHVDFDSGFYRKGMEIYLRNRGWTWSKELPKVTSCKLYVIK